MRVLAGFMKSARALVVIGAQSLLEVVATTTEAGRRDPSDACWMLQLEMLRLLGRQQEFEDLSIEYCVTYEVSPPSWEALPPSVQLASATSVRATGEPQASESLVSSQGNGLTLSGELEGRIQGMVAALREYAQHHTLIQLDCARLRRIDFGAAGELLNEVVALQAAGKYLRFKDVNHLVAALMSVMGIPDLAEVSMRRL
jgi:ABC-type transporter Mla MlaB component